MSQLQDATKREMFQSHIAAATGQSNFGSLHAKAGPEDSLSEICKLLVDTTAERMGNETINHRDSFDENDDSIRENLKTKNRAHDIYLKSPTVAIHDTLKELRREEQRAQRVMENEWLLKYSGEMQGHFDRCDKKKTVTAL